MGSEMSFKEVAEMLSVLNLLENASQKVCSYEKFGICTRREECDLYHPTENCDDETCNIVNCRRRHPQPCKFFGTPRGCSFGSSCKFAHNTTENCSDVNCNLVNCSKRHPEPCKFFGTKDGCRFGDSCMFDHRKPMRAQTGTSSQPQMEKRRSMTTPELVPSFFDFLQRISQDHLPRNRGERVQVKSSNKIFNEDLPMEILRMIFDDQILDYEDILECRLVSRGWRCLVQELGLMKCAELMVSSPEMVEEVLENDLFLAVGTLYLTLDYGDFDADEWEKANDNLTKMFTTISQRSDSPLECLKLHGLQ